ncbi:hypothetical protein HBH45_080960 [Parastagonospora nodorum]|nr:hypothetical protein HBH45_080960 [Parastagonospora nodorum]
MFPAQRGDTQSAVTPHKPNHLPNPRMSITSSACIKIAPSHDVGTPACLRSSDHRLDIQQRRNTTGGK